MNQVTVKSASPPFLFCLVRKEVPAEKYFCEKISGNVGTAIQCNTCRSPHRLCYLCRLEGRHREVAGPPNGKGLCWECLGYPRLPEDFVPWEERRAISPPPVETPPVAFEAPVSLLWQDELLAMHPELSELVPRVFALLDPHLPPTQRLSVNKGRKIARYADSLQAGIAKKVLNKETKVGSL